MKQIIVNAIMAMDGTILQSHNRHDYKEYTCEIEGVEFFCSVDGGMDYLKRGGKYTEMSLYEDDPFEIIRLFLCRGGRGEDGTVPLSYTPLFKMSTPWLEALIKYETNLRPDNLFLPYYIKEKKYRDENFL